jgi:hypothetical protein
VFYDNWVARDINGTALENAPFEQIFHHTESERRFMRHLPVQGEEFVPGGGPSDQFLTVCSSYAYSPIVLERDRRTRPRSVLQPAPREVQDG